MGHRSQVADATPGDTGAGGPSTSGDEDLADAPVFPDGVYPVNPGSDAPVCDGEPVTE